MQGQQLFLHQGFDSNEQSLNQDHSGIQSCSTHTFEGSTTCQQPHIIDSLLGKVCHLGNALQDKSAQFLLYSAASIVSKSPSSLCASHQIWNREMAQDVFLHVLFGTPAAIAWFTSHSLVVGPKQLSRWAFVSSKSLVKHPSSQVGHMVEYYSIFKKLFRFKIKVIKFMVSSLGRCNTSLLFNIFLQALIPFSRGKSV